jgi:hypothetical protein
MISAENSPLIGIPESHPNGKASNGTQERNPDGDPLKNPSFTGILKNPGESMPWAKGPLRRSETEDWPLSYEQLR